MTYTLWKKVENHGRGCPSDGSESWTQTVEFHVVSAEEEDNYAEFQASEYGNQDYSYKVDFVRIATYDSMDEVNEVKTKLELKYGIVKEAE